MDRRRFIAVACTALPVVVAGCSNDSGPSTDTEPSTVTGPSTDTGPTTGTAPTTTASQFDPADDIAIVVSNGRPDPVTVTLTVTRAGTQVFDGTLTVDADGRHTLDPGIDDLGDYELTVTLDDGTESVRPFDVESYDRRMGSNLIVEIGDHDVMVLMEE